ncbi:hypothetical protein MSMTP_2842 [Methanosarcina sp. MTP4]|uniref:TIR domain-containing protein n=1 Tax=Methanosarcina sp. MTP4 TaxID=1434100 RepID=UPI000615C333|nr:TIR domain-containing protein [Methanosarcina sp. MTP4]AKB26311.1 hypothetical protein MSMTP_2842 [Methanosarcina sp. MTP4]
MTGSHHPEFKYLNLPKVFICYSHEDEIWKNRLLANLKILINRHILDCWHDDNIHGGECISEKIFEAIDNSSIAILLLSQYFLGSDFIQDKEIPRILKRHELGYIHIYPIIVRHCNWNQFDWLSNNNIMPNYATPLSDGNDNSIDREFVKIIDDIEEVCKNLKKNLKFEDKCKDVDNGGNLRCSSNSKFIQKGPMDPKETAVLIAKIGITDLGENGNQLNIPDKKPNDDKTVQKRKEYYKKKEKIIQTSEHHCDSKLHNFSEIPKVVENSIFEYFKSLLESNNFYDFNLLLLDPLIEYVKKNYNIKEIVIFYIEESAQQTHGKFIAHIIKKILCLKKYSFNEFEIKVEPIPNFDEEKTINRYRNEIEKIPHDIDNILFSLVGGASRQNTPGVLQSIDFFPAKTKLILKQNQENKIFVYDIYERALESTIKSTCLEGYLKCTQNNEILRCILLSKIKIIEKLITDDTRNSSKSEDKFTKSLLLNDLGKLLLEMKLTYEAKENFEEALQVLRQLTTDYPENPEYASPEYRYFNAKILFNLGETFLDENKFVVAKSNFEGSLEISKELLNIYPHKFNFQSLLLETIIKLVEIHLEIGEESSNNEECLTHALKLCDEYKKFGGANNFEDNWKIIIEYKLKALLSLSLVRAKKSEKEDVLEIYENCIASIEKLKNNTSDEKIIKLCNSIYHYLQGKKILSEAMGCNPPNFSYVEKSIESFKIAMDTSKGNEQSVLANEIFEKSNACFQIYSLFLEFRNTQRTGYEVSFNKHATIEKDNLMFSIIDRFPNELGIKETKGYLEDVVRLWSEKDPSKRKEKLAIINTSIEEIRQIKFRKIVRVLFDEAKEILMMIPTTEKNVLSISTEATEKKESYVSNYSHINSKEIKQDNMPHNMEVCRIGAVQIDFDLTESFPPEITEKQKTKTKILQTLDIAQREKVNIVCLPELCMCEECLSEIENRYSDMIVIAGSYYDKEGHNVCRVVMDSDRNILPAQFKITPSVFEDSSICGSGMVPGEKTNIYDETPFGKFAVLICRDFGNYYDSLRNKTDILFVPSYNSASDRFHQLAHSHVSDSLAYVVIANASNKGGTSIFGRMAHKHFPKLVKMGYKEENDQSFKLCELKKNEEGIIIADFNLRYKSIPTILTMDPSEEHHPVKYIKVFNLEGKPLIMGKNTL